MLAKQMHLLDWKQLTNWQFYTRINVSWSGAPGITTSARVRFAMVEMRNIASEDGTRGRKCEKTISQRRRLGAN
jgi:hypothetical protein